MKDNKLLEIKQSFISGLNRKKKKALVIDGGVCLFYNLDFLIRIYVEKILIQGNSFSGIIKGYDSNSLSKTGKVYVYVVVSTHGNFDEFSRIDGVFLSKKEAEDYIEPREEPYANSDIRLRILENYVNYPSLRV